MSPFLFCIAFLTALTSFGQTICLTAAQHEATARQLAKEYIQVEKVIDPAYDPAGRLGDRTQYELTPGEKKRMEIGAQFGKDLNQALRQAKVLQDTACYLIVSLYANADGSINRVHFEPNFQFSALRIDSLTGVRLQNRVRSVLCPWFSTYRFPVTGEKPYRYFTGLPIGKLPTQRKLRRGPGILTTLEEAEKTSRPDTVKNLVFNTLELKEIPEVIYRFPNLEVLDLSSNSLHQIPDRVFRIPKLKQLNASFNPLGNDGLKVARNKHLKILNIQSTGIITVPKTVSRNRRLESLWLGLNDFSGGLNTAPLRRLRKLNDLNLYRANLAELPRTIHRLKRLEVLDLYYNKLRVLPERIGRMRRLQQLALSNNQLHDLPEQIGRMRSLQVLYTHHNFLASLPASVQKLYTLRILDIGHNAFSRVPEPLLHLPYLEELDISHNRLSELPMQLSQLQTLRKLYLRGNPISEQKKVSASLIKDLEKNSTEVFY